MSDDEIQDNATSYRSIWKPSHGFNGLLVRINENAVVVSYHDGEVVVQLQKIIRVLAAGQSMYFVHAKSFRCLGFNDNGVA